MNYRKISAKIILLLLVLLPFFSAFPASAALLKVALKSDYIQINGGGTAYLSIEVKNSLNAPVSAAAIVFTATPASCTPPAAATTGPDGKNSAPIAFTGPITPPTVVCIIKATVTSGPDSGSASTTVVVGSDYAPLVPLPGIGSPTSFPAYLVGLYELALISIGIFAMLMILYGGFKYMTSAGNPALMGDAKDAIWSAIFGLILALLSWLILGTVNPELTMIKTPGTAFSPFTAPTGTIGNTACSLDGNLTIPTCRCIDGATVGRSVGYDTLPCNQICNDSYPNIVISGAGGSGAIARVTTITAGVIQNSIAIVNGGTGYPVAATTVTIVGGNGTNATATAAVTAGVVTAITVTNGGTGYGYKITTDLKNHCQVVDFKMGQMNEEGNSLPTDKERAQKYALYSGDDWTTPLMFSFDFTKTSSCFIAINAKDHTFNFDTIVKMTIDSGKTSGFNGDCNKATNIDLLFPNSATPVNGYIGPQVIPASCPGDGFGNIFANWASDTNCITSIEPAGITCPVKMCVEYADGTKREKIHYIEYLQP